MIIMTVWPGDDDDTDYYDDNDNDNDRVARLETELCGANDVITQLRHELQVRV